MPIPASATARAATDRCPGALQLLAAADGHLARVRLPGGFVTGPQLRVLASLALELGDGRVELTSRGNVQLRALAADAADELSRRLEAAGLLPSLSHDRVRNIVASPLAGLAGLAGPAGLAGLDASAGPDLAPLVAALDAALCSRPRLAELPGRFLFAIDDGRGEVTALGADVVAQLGPDGATVNGLAGVDLVTTMLEFAEAFLDERAALASTAWRITDLPDGAADRIRAQVAGRLGLRSAVPQPPPSEATGATGATEATGATGATGPTARPVGIVHGPAGASSSVVVAPLGRLSAGQLHWLADRLAVRPARITPWRSVVLPELADAAATVAAAAELGFGVDAGSPWLRVTACAGRPGCASALGDVQADAPRFAAQWPGRLLHLSGCERHCGRPGGTEIDVVATSKGYQVVGV